MKTIKIIILFCCINHLAFSQSIFNIDTIKITRYYIDDDTLSLLNPFKNQDYKLYIKGDSLIMKMYELSEKHQEIPNWKDEYKSFTYQERIRIDSINRDTIKYSPYMSIKYTTIYNKSGDQYYYHSKFPLMNNSLTYEKIINENVYKFYITPLYDNELKKHLQEKNHDRGAASRWENNYLPFFPKGRFKSIEFNKNSKIISTDQKFVYKGDTMRAIVSEYYYSSLYTDDFRNYFLPPNDLSPTPDWEKRNLYANYSVTNGILVTEYASGLPIMILEKTTYKKTTIKHKTIDDNPNQYKIAFLIDGLQVLGFPIEEYITIRQ